MAEETKPRLSLTDWVVLALIDETPRHGFSVARELREGGPVGQVWTVNPPLVYRAVDHLHGCGLIERVGTEPGAKGPIRTVYRTTSLGGQRVAAWLEEPVEHPREIRTEFLAKLVISIRRGLPLSGLITRQLDMFAPAAAGLAAKAEGAEGVDRVVALWRLESMRSISSFLEGMVG